MELYLNYGEEDFLREYNSNKIIDGVALQNKSMNLIKLNDSNLDKLIDNCEQMPFFDDKKVIYIKNSGLFASSNKKISSDMQERIITYIEDLPSYIVMVFNEESVDKRLTAYKKISKLAKCNEYKFQSEADLATWIIRGMKTLGGTIDMEEARYLANVCGPSMSYLYTEIQKLAILSSEGEKITEKIIDDVCIKSEQGIIFDLTDSIGAKNSAKALKLIDNLIMQKQAEQYILIMLYKHIRMLYTIKLAQSEGEYNEKDLKINPYVLKKASSQVRQFELSKLYGMLEYLIDLDYNSKNGKIDIRVGLDIFAASI